MNNNRQRMLAGQSYNPLDKVLVNERIQAHKLCRQISFSPDLSEPEQTALWQQLLPHKPNQAFIEPPFFCDYGNNIRLGKRTFINANCTFLDCAEITIGDRAMLGPNVQLYTANHPLSAKTRATLEETAHGIDIGEDCWLGGGVIVLPGVRIGARSVIGAGSVVTKDIPEDVMAAGNPCRVIKAIEA